MSSKVLHGEGKPRIIVPTSVILSGNTRDAGTTWVELDGSPTIPSTVRGKMVYTANVSAQITKGRIIDYNDTGDTLTVTGWDNGLPDPGAPYEVKGFNIDLPYCESLTETFQPLFKPLKKYFSTKKKIRQLEGWYYYATLDYSSFMEFDTLTLLKPLFDTATLGEFTFLPRRDNPNVTYQCNLLPDGNFDIAQLTEHQGHKNVTIQLEGLELLSKIELEQQV